MRLSPSRFAIVLAYALVGSSSLLCLVPWCLLCTAQVLITGRLAISAPHAARLLALLIVAGLFIVTGLTPLR